MGEAVPVECVSNALPVNDGWGTLWSPDVRCIWDALREWLAEQAEGGMAAAQLLLEEEGKEEDLRRGSYTAGGLAPREVPEPEEGRPVRSGFWHRDQDDQEEWWEAPISKKAWGKAPAVELPPPERDEQLA